MIYSIQNTIACIIVYSISMVCTLSLQAQKSKTYPEFSTVFPQNKVNRIEITIKASDWKKLTDQLTVKFGKMNKGRFPGPPQGMNPDSMFKRFSGDSIRMPRWGRDSFNRMAGPPPQFRGGRPPFPGNRPGPGGKMMGFPGFDSVKDIYVPANISFNGLTWKNTGFRFKGNSSLMMSSTRGIKKLPFRLNFSKYGDSIPEIKGRKFYGFKELTFSNNISDNSFLHEKIASDLFRETGLMAPHTAFYEVYIDCGEGLTYAGLYTCIEIVEDTMLKDQFGSEKGNCYKPEGSFAQGSFDKKSMKKKNNKKKEDYSDVQKLYEIINDQSRITNVSVWKSRLDSIFDIPVFIKWLAVNNTIQNWDTYGLMPHNYYLYNNPKTGKLTWIPWDNNEALNSGRFNELSVSLSEVSSDWPLIRYILDQPEYNEMYRRELSKFVHTIFNPTYVKDKIELYSHLIYPYASQEKKGYTFLSSPEAIIEGKNQLMKHIDNRFKLVSDYLNKMQTN
jgi:spore coat protein H